MPRGYQLPGLFGRYANRLHRAAIRALEDGRGYRRPLDGLGVRPCLDGADKMDFARGVLAVGRRGFQGPLATHGSTAYHVARHRVPLFDDIGYLAAACLWNYGSVLVDLLLSQAHLRGGRSSSGGRAAGERGLLPRLGCCQFPEAGLSVLCQNQDQHSEKATSQDDGIPNRPHGS
jgi:hypothetical protein